VSETSTYLLLKTQDKDDVENMDLESSTDIVQFFLDALSYYFTTPVIGRVSFSKDQNNLCNTLVKDIEKLDRLGRTKKECLFSLVREWFWKEGILNVMVMDGQDMTAVISERFYKLLVGIAEMYQDDEGVTESNLYPVLRKVFWDRLHPKEIQTPSLDATKSMFCILRFCGVNNIISDKDTSSSQCERAIESFCSNTFFGWIHKDISSITSNETRNSQQTEIYFAMLSLILKSIMSSEQRKALWESLFSLIINKDVDLMKISSGLQKLVTENGSETASDFSSQALDSFSVKVAKDVVQHQISISADSNRDSNIEDHSVYFDACVFFLKTCAGLSYGMNSCLVSSDAIDSWVELCLSTQESSIFSVYLVRHRNQLLEILLSLCTKSFSPIKEENVLNLLVQVWNEGPPTWNMKEIHDLLAPNSSLTPKMINLASMRVCSELKNSELDLNHATDVTVHSSVTQSPTNAFEDSLKRIKFHKTVTENFDSSAFIWSQRSWRLVQLYNNSKDGPLQGLHLIGMGDSDLWTSAINGDSSTRCDYLYMALVYFLQNITDIKSRRSFLLESGDGTLLHIFMTLAKNYSNYSDQSQIFRCSFVSRLLGDLSTIPQEKVEGLVFSAIEILSSSLKTSSSQNEVHLGIFILDWFVSLLLHKINISSLSESSLSDEVQQNDVKAGDELWYVTDNRKIDSERVKATIVKIHEDDYPNLYFTVEIGDKVKQTVSSRLKRNQYSQNHEKMRPIAPTNKVALRIEESMMNKIVKPYFKSENNLLNETAADCLNIVVSRCGLMGNVGIGTIRHDTFKLLSSIETEIHGLAETMSVDNIDTLSSYLKRISLSLGYGMYTSSSKNNTRILSFNCDSLMSSLLSLFDRDEASSFLNGNEESSLNLALSMWLTISSPVALNERNAGKIWSLADDTISGVVTENCYDNHAYWLTILVHLLESTDNATSLLPTRIKAVTIASEQSLASNLINIFVNCKDQELKSSDRGKYVSDLEIFNDLSIDEPSWFKRFHSFITTQQRLYSSSISFAARMEVEGLLNCLKLYRKQWCSYQMLKRIAEEQNPLYKKENALPPSTCQHLDNWLGSLDEEEAAEIEEDVIVSGMWLPRYLMDSLENFGERETKENEEQSETLISSYLLEWLLCLDFLDAAGSSDMRNRSHIGSYIKLTGALKHVLNLALCYTDLDNRKEKERKWVKCTAIDVGKIDFNVSDLSMLVLFRTVESIPTLFKSWWEEDCPRAVQSTISKFVENVVAPETLRRELDRIKITSSLGELSVTGSCVSREVMATYVQDESKLSVIIRIPKQFPLRNVEVDCQKTLGVSEKRWRHWSLQIMLMLNSQDGSILDALLLWKQNVDKEFEGVEPCPVCYSVLCVKTHAMPNLECNTCHNRFHRSCLYKWFGSSGKSQCVLCQQPWSGTKVGS